MLPLLQFPKSGAYRTDKVGGPVEDDSPTTAPSRTVEWEDVDGDGQIVIGAEQWPECLNPITECANSSWYLWALRPDAPGRLGHRPTTHCSSRPSWSPASRSSKSC